MKNSKFTDLYNQIISEMKIDKSDKTISETAVKKQNQKH